MPIRDFGLANPQPLVELQHNPYQVAFLQAQGLRICAEGHEWTIEQTPSWQPRCPICQNLGQRAFHRLLLRAGRRGGKTRIGAVGAIREATIPDTIGWCCAPTYRDLEDFVMPAFRKQLPQAWIDHPASDWKASQYTLYLPNRSIVQFRSLEEADAGRGPGLHWLWIDEICKISELHWETIRPTLSDYRGLLIATTTPKGEDWVHETFYQRAEEGFPGFWACSYPTRANPFIQAEELAEAEATMTPLMFRQEYMADIVTFQGAIYGDLVDRVVIEGTDEQMRAYFPTWPHLDTSYPSVTGLDPGADHPFAGIHLVASPFGLVAVGEYLERDKPFMLHAQGIQQLRRGFASRVGIDPSQRQTRTELAQYGLYTVDAENDVVAGINRVSAWMLAAKRDADTRLPYGGLVLPKQLVPQTIKQLRSYRWADNVKKDGTTKNRELVYKKRDDLPDALRYGLMTYPTLPVRHPEVLQQRDISYFDSKTQGDILRMRRVDAAERKAEAQAQEELRSYVVDEPVYESEEGLY